MDAPSLPAARFIVIAHSSRFLPGCAPHAAQPLVAHPLDSHPRCPRPRPIPSLSRLGLPSPFSKTEPHSRQEVIARQLVFIDGWVRPVSHAHLGHSSFAPPRTHTHSTPAPLRLSRISPPPIPRVPPPLQILPLYKAAAILFPGARDRLQEVASNRERCKEIMHGTEKKSRRWSATPAAPAKLD